jgi:hypothetical protein
MSIEPDREAGDVHPFIQAIEACKDGLRSRDREVRKAAIMALDKYIHGGKLPELSITKSGGDCNNRCHMEDGYCVPDPITT